MIKAKIIADSKNEFGNRITTMVVTFPRFILAELNTHRMMSRNSASSRAIPFEKMLESVSNNPFVPIAIQKDHKGMQGTEYLEGRELDNALSNWGKACDNAIIAAKVLAENGVTKQLCNRLLEPFMWHTVIITATEWENFFTLRCPKYSIREDKGGDLFRSRKDIIAKYGNDETHLMTELDWLKKNTGQAEIHMMELAEQMWDEMNESTPKELKAGEWHIPFGDDFSVDLAKKVNFEEYNWNNFQSPIKGIEIKVATARCARVSYTVVGEEGKPANYENDIKLHDRLAESGHWSPFEHCAQAMSQEEYVRHVNGILTNGKFEIPNAEGYVEGWSGNFRGFIQYRKTFQNENITNGN